MTEYKPYQFLYGYFQKYLCQQEPFMIKSTKEPQDYYVDNTKVDQLLYAIRSLRFLIPEQIKQRKTFSLYFNGLCTQIQMIIRLLYDIHIDVRGELEKSETHSECLKYYTQQLLNINTISEIDEFHRDLHYLMLFVCFLTDLYIRYDFNNTELNDLFSGLKLGLQYKNIQMYEDNDLFMDTTIDKSVSFEQYVETKYKQRMNTDVLLEDQLPVYLVALLSIFVYMYNLDIIDPHKVFMPDPEKVHGQYIPTLHPLYFPEDKHKIAFVTPFFIIP